MKKVLVIDDEPVIRELLKEVIEDLGYRYAEASRIKNGINKLQKGDIDLILLDIQLPQTNGLEGIQLIREIDKSIPIFVISAFHNMESVIEMLDEEIQEFIKKPFEMHILGKKIKKILGGDSDDKEL
ncbi:MAG: response regulator [Fusobacteriota bacterium]